MVVPAKSMGIDMVSAENGCPPVPAVRSAARPVERVSPSNGLPADPS